MTPEKQELIGNMLVVATLLPLFGSFALLFFGKRFLGNVTGYVATALMGVSFVCSVIALSAWMSVPGDKEPIVWLVKWIPMTGMSSPWLYLGLLADSLTLALMVMVTGISTLVHLYSIGYMCGDKRFERFFVYLLLFTFSMLGIVTANGLVQLFVCWELVGLTSYLLIGFWHEKKGPQQACKKAFVMNRIGDMGFLIGFGILFYKLGGQLLLPATQGVMVDGQAINSMYGAIQSVLSQESLTAGLTGQAAYTFTNPPFWLTAAGIGLFFGAMGKSAQFPLHTWLPDAMEGPTPVSSIVHSATMVAAGVYLTSRIMPILSPGAHLFVATIGLITLVMAACMALVMTDIKRVLAYSTLSQLGYMILALGAGAYTFALFHLITHAFFKCCLFQCSGSVINAAHHEQDMRQYGGLAKKMPLTCLSYFICTLAISGASIPYMQIGGFDIGISGYFSKDGIIAGTVNYGQALEGAGWWGNLFWIGPMVIAYVTVFYMARSFALTFLGKPRNQHLHDHVKEASFFMTIPQLCLAAMAILTAPFLMGFWQELIIASEPGAHILGTNYQHAAVLSESHGMHTTHAYLLYGFGWMIALALGIFIYRPGFVLSSKIVKIPVIKQLYTWALNKFYFDALYDIFVVALFKCIAAVCAFFDQYIIDGIVNLTGLLGKAGAYLVGRFDENVVDGIVNGAATSAQNTGALLRQPQAGRVRVYVLTAFVSFALAMVAVLVSSW